MKKHFTLLMILIPLLGLKSFAQESKFIELVVSDTVILQPTKIFYQVKIGTSENPFGMDFGFDNADDNKDIPAPALMDIESMLEHKKFTFTVTNDKTYTLNGKEQQEFILAELPNEQELMRLYETLKDVKGISGSIYDVEFESIEKYYNSLYNSVFTKAKNQATMLASITGNSIGKVISISDVENANSDYMSMMENAMNKNPFASLFGNMEGLSKEVVVQMRVKFEMI